MLSASFAAGLLAALAFPRAAVADQLRVFADPRPGFVQLASAVSGRDWIL